MRTHTLVALLAAGSLLVACGDRGGDAEARPQGGDEPVTARALAAVIADRIDTPDSARTDDDIEELGKGAVAVEVRFGSTGEYDGDLLSVTVSPRPQMEQFTCDGDLVPSPEDCVDLEGGGRLFWERQEPEEDPGVVYLAVPKGDATVFVYQAGPDVTGDPRELDMPISVDDMIGLAEDPRVDVTTSEEAVAAGEKLDWWYDG